MYVDHENSWSEHVLGAEEAGVVVEGHYWFNGRAASIESQVDTFFGARVDGTDRGIEPGEWAMWDVENEGTTLARWSPSEVRRAAVHAFDKHSKPYDEQLLYLSSSVTFEEDWSAIVALGIPLMVAHYVPVRDNLPVGKVLVNHWKPGMVKLWQFTSSSIPLIRQFYDANLDVNVRGDYDRAIWTVLELQEGINELEILDTPLHVDGKWGPRTDAGTRELQKFLGIHIDGKAGTNTLTELEKRLA